MKVAVLGVNYNARWEYNGASGKGCKLYVAHPDNNVVGDLTESYFVNDNMGAVCELARSLKPGDAVNLDLNRWGKIVDINPV